MSGGFLWEEWLRHIITTVSGPSSSAARSHPELGPSFPSSTSSPSSSPSLASLSCLPVWFPRLNMTMAILLSGTRMVCLMKVSWRRCESFLLPSVQEVDLLPIPHRRQPLQHLTTFSVNFMDTLTLVKIQSIFEVCPGLISFVNPQLHPIINTYSLTRFIAERCPQIQKINHYRDNTDNQLALDLMVLLPPDTVQDLTITRFDKDWQGLIPVAGRHKGSLRKVDFVRCCRLISGKVKEEVFGQCLGLKVPHLDIDPYTAR